MTLLRNVKKAISKPYKAFNNKVIPVINSINNYLDVWFPQDKWNWRKIAIGWAALQVVVITALEIKVALDNIKQVKYIHRYYMSLADTIVLSQLSVADSLSVYHMIFTVAQFFQFYLVCDTVIKSSTLQLLPGTLFSYGIAIYSIVQYIQAKAGIQIDYVKNIEDEKKNEHLHTANIEIIIIILMGIFCFGWTIITLRLYKIFGWNVFKQLGADIGVKNRLKLYQIFLALLKIDIFFFTGFTMQFLIFVVTYIKESMKAQVINIVLLVINFIMPFLGIGATRKENYKIMCLFIIFLSISIGYMVFSFVDILVDKQKNSSNCEKENICIAAKYRNCFNSLSIACIMSIVLGVITFVLALINFKNFPKGLKKDKTIRPSTSHNSTLSSSYNTQKRWSIE